MKLFVESYCSLTTQGLFKNGEELFSNNTSFNDFLKSIYKAKQLSYAKFFKMDELCKLAFIASEILLEQKDLSLDKTAIILGNSHSSNASDQKHQESIKNRNNYFPSPAVFVYTLPNIMLGELCIRHKITGENSCFLMEGFDVAYFNEYVRDLFKHESYKYCITGWVDFQPDKYEAHLFLITDNGDDAKQLFNKSILQLIH